MVEAVRRGGNSRSRSVVEAGRHRAWSECRDAPRRQAEDGFRQTSRRLGPRAGARVFVWSAGAQTRCTAPERAEREIDDNQRSEDHGNSSDVSRAQRIWINRKLDNRHDSGKAPEQSEPQKELANRSYTSPNLFGATSFEVVGEAIEVGAGRINGSLGRCFKLVDVPRGSSSAQEAKLVGPDAIAALVDSQY